MNRLPQELVDMIIDHLHNDTRALKHASLVCKAWVQPCRYHLFSFFALYRTKAKEFLPWGLAVLSFSQKLLIEGRCEWKEGLSDDHVSLLGGSKNMRSVAIALQSLNSKSLATQLLHAKQFANVVDLELYHVNTDTASEFAHMICAYSCLERLILTASSWLSTDKPPTKLRLPCNLHYLALRIGRSSCVLEWLISVEEKPALRTVLFNLYKPDLDDHAIIGRSLQALAPTLQSIGWMGETCFNSPYSSPAFDLSNNTALRFVYFDLDNYIDGPTSFIISILSGIISQDIDWVAFKLRTPRAELDDVDWLAVDAILMQSKFSGLRTVEFYRVNRRCKFNTAWLATHLPLCHARGLLSFSDSYMPSLFPLTRYLF